MNENLYSIQLEQSVLSMLLSVTAGIDEAMEKLTDESFYAARNQVIFKAIKSLYSKGRAFDAIAVYDVIKMDSNSTQLVTEAYLMEVLQVVSVADLFIKHIEQLNDHARRRSLFSAGERIKSISLDTTQYGIDDAIAQSESVLASIEKPNDGDTLKNAFDLSVNLFGDITRRMDDREKGQEKLNGIRTGFTDLDKKIGLLTRGDLIYIGARPSMGKTAFAQDIMLDVTFMQQHPVLFHSIEMSAEKIAQRIISSMAEINSHDIRDAKIPDDKWGDFNKASLMLQKSNFFIDDNSNVTVSDIRRNCRRIKHKHGYVGAVFIDYLTLIKSNEKSDRNDLIIGGISKSLKKLAKEFDCPVICLSQLSRSLEKRVDKRPLLSDLRESGSIEEDADVVLFIYRDDYYNKDSKEKGIAEINAAKVRDGEVGVVRLATELQYSRFLNLDPEYYMMMHDH
jgi:replicative DNA helicase